MTDAITKYLASNAISSAMATLARRDVSHWIDGVPVSQGTPIDVFEASTATVLCQTFESDDELVKRAVAAARAALTLPLWAGLRPLDRQALILKLADLIEKHGDELAFLESIDVGKPVGQAGEIDIGGSVDVLRYFAGWSGKIDGRAAPLSGYDSQYFGMTLKRPVGVVGAIVPWNFPLQTLVWKSAAALAAGCTMVIKPSEITPLTALRFAELASEAGFPNGVINVVNGTGPITGAALVSHPDVDKITFTGSTEAGLIVGRSALATMKRLTLELGGKSPVLVTNNADIDRAVEGVINGIFFNAGQVCDAGSRLILEDAIHDQFLEKLVARVRKLPIGAGLESETFIGPLASGAHKSKVVNFVAMAKNDKLDIALDRGDQPRDGYFHGPVIICNCPTTHSCWTDEIFGPVLVVCRAANTDDMLVLANDTRFGLGAAVFSENHNEVMSMVRRLRAGTVYVNGHGFLDAAFPFGGQGMSGFGKDLGPEQLESYLETTSVLFEGQSI